MKNSKRYSLVLREPYVKALDKLVETGVYFESQEIIREALRFFFEKQGIAPFYKETKEIGADEL